MEEKPGLLSHLSTIVRVVVIGLVCVIIAAVAVRLFQTRQEDNKVAKQSSSQKEKDESNKQGTKDEAKKAEENDAKKDDEASQSSAGHNDHQASEQSTNQTPQSSSKTTPTVPSVGASGNMVGLSVLLSVAAFGATHYFQRQAKSSKS